MELEIQYYQTRKDYFDVARKDPQAIPKDKAVLAAGVAIRRVFAASEKLKDIFYHNDKKLDSMIDSGSSRNARGKNGYSETAYSKPL